MSNNQVWYRETWPWFIIILLSASILGAVSMSIIAFKHSPAEIDSHWYQDAALTKRKRQQVAFIKHLHLQAQLNLKQGDITLDLNYDPVKLTAAQKKLLDVEELWLYIAHPVKPEYDQKIHLQRMAEHRYHGQITAALSGKRQLLISPNSELWYLTSQAYFPVSQIQFSPDLG